MAAMRPSAGLAKDCEITCLACGGPLPSREGQFVLKYFLLSRSGDFKRRGFLVIYGAALVRTWKI
jgi:hypothetical protein